MEHYPDCSAIKLVSPQLHAFASPTVSAFELTWHVENVPEQKIENFDRVWRAWRAWRTLIQEKKIHA